MIIFLNSTYFGLKFSALFTKYQNNNKTTSSSDILERHSGILCFPDEINWPDGEDTPPLDAQELITLLLRQNPLERMGAGKNTTSALLRVPLSHWWWVGGLGVWGVCVGPGEG